MEVEGITQVHDSSVDSYNSIVIALHPQGNAAHNQGEDNDIEFPNVGIQVWEGSHEKWVADVNNKRYDFVHHSIEDVERTENLCEVWLRKARQAKLLAAQTKQHLQKVKERCNHIEHECSDLMRSATHEILWGVKEDTYITNLKCAPISYDMAAIYLFIGDLIFLHYAWISGCHDLFSKAFSDLAWTT